MQNTDKTQDTIRKHVRGAIKAKRFQSTHAVAKRAGIPVSSLQTFMSGNQRLSEKHYAALANTLQVSVDELTGKREQNGHERLAAWKAEQASNLLTNGPLKSTEAKEIGAEPFDVGFTSYGQVISRLMALYGIDGERRYVEAAKTVLEMM